MRSFFRGITLLHFLLILYVAEMMEKIALKLRRRELALICGHLQEICLFRFRQFNNEVKP